MLNIEKKVMQFIKQNNLLDETQKLYVATSGGADSMSMLAFFHTHIHDITSNDIELAAVHVNHGIRGETARRDANFVKAYCEQNGIEFILFDAEQDGTIVPKNASEEWARQLRYNYFSKISDKGVKIATAHTLSDQLETVLFRMARGGSGLNGMSGIPVKRGVFIRPFLCINRSEVEELVEHYKTGNITDETNLGDAYSRNKIRHTVVPVLKEINPSAEESVGKLCSRMEKAQKYIEKQAASRLYEFRVIEGIKYSIDAFIGADEIIIDEMIIQLMRGIGIQSEQNVEVAKNYIYNVNMHEAFEVIAGELQLNERYSIVISNRYVTIKDNISNQMGRCNFGYNPFGIYGYNVKISVVTQNKFKQETVSKYNLCRFADASKLDLSKCIIRARKEGDVFKPACRMEGKLVKFMRSEPLAERDFIPVIEYEGRIIWVWGVGFTDGFTPTDETNNIIKVDWHNDLVTGASYD